MDIIASEVRTIRTMWGAQLTYATRQLEATAPNLPIARRRYERQIETAREQLRRADALEKQAS